MSVCGKDKYVSYLINNYQVYACLRMIGQKETSINIRANLYKCINFEVNMAK